MGEPGLVKREAPAGVSPGARRYGRIQPPGPLPALKKLSPQGHTAYQTSKNRRNTVRMVLK